MHCVKVSSTARY